MIGFRASDHHSFTNDAAMHEDYRDRARLVEAPSPFYLRDITNSMLNPLSYLYIWEALKRRTGGVGPQREIH